MNHAHAAQAATACIEQEVGEGVARLVAGQAVQIELSLHRPMTAPQADEHVGAQARAQKRLLCLLFLADFPRRRRRFGAEFARGKRVRFVSQPLGRRRRGTRLVDARAVAGRQRSDVGECLAQVDVGVELRGADGRALAGAGRSGRRRRRPWLAVGAVQQGLQIRQLGHRAIILIAVSPTTVRRRRQAARPRGRPRAIRPTARRS